MTHEAVPHVHGWCSHCGLSWEERLSEARCLRCGRSLSNVKVHQPHPTEEATEVYKAGPNRWETVPLGEPTRPANIPERVRRPIGR